MFFLPQCVRLRLRRSLDRQWLLPSTVSLFARSSRISSFYRSQPRLSHLSLVHLPLLSPPSPSPSLTSLLHPLLPHQPAPSSMRPSLMPRLPVRIPTLTGPPHPPAPYLSQSDSIDLLTEFLEEGKGKTCVLTGAGVSVDSGIRVRCPLMHPARL